MRTGEAFVLGAIMGAAVVWLWGRRDGGVRAGEDAPGAHNTAAEAFGR